MTTSCDADSMLGRETGRQARASASRSVLAVPPPAPPHGEPLYTARDKDTEDERDHQNQQPQIDLHQYRSPSTRRLTAQRRNIALAHLVNTKQKDRQDLRRMRRAIFCLPFSGGTRAMPVLCRYQNMIGPRGAAAGARPDMYGARNPRWKGGGQNDRTKTYRDNAEASVWRRAVTARDRRKCQLCESKLPRGIAHHILPWSECEAMRFDVNNGVCLCRDCHVFVHSPANVDGLYLAAAIHVIAL
jgi:hypothetical protein